MAPAWQSTGVWISVMWLLGVLGAMCVLIVYASKRNWGVEALPELLRQGGFGVSLLRLLTVALVIGAVEVLALEGKVSGDASIAVLSGVAGYVLGGLPRDHRNHPTPPLSNE